MKPGIPDNEVERLAALKDYHILDTAGEQVFDDITLLATHICEAPAAFISLVDESRQWFKARVGVEAVETPREVAFCAHAILQTTPLVVSDATKDARFAGSELVEHSPFIRFYAGYPLINPQGYALGTLCAIDHKPRGLSARQDHLMQALARQVMALLEARRNSTHLLHALEHVKTLRGLLPICAWCKRIRDDAGYWSQVESYVQKHSDADFTHSICPECLERVHTEMAGQQQAATIRARRA